MVDITEGDMQQQIDDMRLKLYGVTKKAAFDQRHWLPKVRKFEKKREEKMYKLAVSGPLFSQ